LLKFNIFEAFKGCISTLKMRVMLTLLPVGYNSNIMDTMDIQ